MVGLLVHCKNAVKVSCKLSLKLRDDFKAAERISVYSPCETVNTAQYDCNHARLSHLCEES